MQYEPPGTSDNPIIFWILRMDMLYRLQKTFGEIVFEGGIVRVFNL
jgi:hypothetical protein